MAYGSLSEHSMRASDGPDDGLVAGASANPEQVKSLMYDPD
jgi:hypothetical protein